MLRLDKDMAVVLLHGGESCKGCGAAALGLCRSSVPAATLTVRNTKGAVPGDTVTVTLDKEIQRKGFLFAYGIPLLCFFAGSLLGYVLGKLWSVASMDVIAGFLALLLSSAFSLRKLRTLNRSSLMSIKRVHRGHSYPCN